MYAFICLKFGGFFLGLFLFLVLGGFCCHIGFYFYSCYVFFNNLILDGYGGRGDLVGLGRREEYDKTYLNLKIVLNNEKVKSNVYCETLKRSK